jgi:O-antigen/teichoic acid export membrane protein
MSAGQAPLLMPPDALETVAALSGRSSQASQGEGSAPLFPWLLAWGTKGGLALADQALFAGAQFALNIVLARWLTVSGYGVFAVAYAVYLLASSVHSALLVEPMVVFGSGRYFERRKSYLEIVLRGHTLLVVPAALLLFVAGFVATRWSGPLVGHSLYALGVALPLTLLSELTRRAFYLEMRPGRAALGGAIYFGALLLLAFGLRAEQFLTPATAILAMGAAAFLTASVQLALLGSHWPATAADLPARTVFSEHWNYGRWILAAVFPSWTLLNLSYLILPAWFGLSAAAGLKAMMNLAMPSRQVLVALGGLLLPLIVRHKHRGGARRVRETTRRVTSIFLAGAAAYLALLWLFRFQIIHLLYGGKYAEYSGLPVLLVGLIPLVTSWTVTLGAAISANERTDLVFRANVIAGAVSLTLGTWLTVSEGVTGAIAGYVVSYGTLAACLWYFHRSSFPHEMSGALDSDLVCQPSHSSADRAE